MQIKKTAGFTLIELILYVALSALVVSSTIGFALNIVYAGARTENQQRVIDAISVANQKITRSTQEATGFTINSSTEISLTQADSSRNPTVFSLSSGQIYMAEGGSGTCSVSSPCAITPDNLVVTSLEFVDTSSNPDSENITFSMTIESQGERAEWNYSRSTQTSIELRN